MALNKTFTTTYGVDVEHSVIQNIGISRTTSDLTFTLLQYPLASNYNNGNSGFGPVTYQFHFDILPSSIMTKIGELKELIEVEMINNLPEWSGATQTYDDGTPMP